MKETKKAIRIIRFTSILIKVVPIVIAVGIAILVLLHLALSIYGKPIFEKKLQEVLKRKVTIQGFRTSFPAYIHASGVNIEGLIRAERITIGIGIFDIFSPNFKLTYLKLVSPVLTFERKNSEPVSQAAAAPAQSDAPPATTPPAEAAKVTAAPPDKAKPTFVIPKFAIRRIKIIDGNINFLDKTVGKDGIRIVLKDLNARIDNLNFTASGSGNTSFKISAKIPWSNPKEEGKINLEGWMNLSKKDMQAILKIEDIDGVYLYPYYSYWVDLEKARIEKAKLSFVSNIIGLNNEVTAQSRLELTDIVRKPRGPDESQEKAERITNAVLDMFKVLNQGKIVLDFTIRTQMDNPKFGFGDIKMAFEDKLAKARKGEGFQPHEVLIFPVKLLEGLVRGLTDTTKAVVVGTVSIGAEVTKAVTGEKKDKKEEEKQEEKKTQQ